MATDPNIVAAMVNNGNSPTSEPSVGPDGRRNEQGQAKANDTNGSGPEEHEKGKGKAVRNGPTITPEATPEPEDARNKADERRGKEEGKSADSESDPTANGQHDNDTSDAPESSAGEGDVIKYILKCGRDEHHKVLGISESYPNQYEEEKAIEQATWKRGTDTHPKYNKGKDAQKAFDSTYASSSFYHQVLSLDSRSHRGSSGVRL
jgi:hypothetical protein